jgi:hypothetical protein
MVRSGRTDGSGKGEGTAHETRGRGCRLAGWLSANQRQIFQGVECLLAFFQVDPTSALRRGRYG